MIFTGLPADAFFFFLSSESLLTLKGQDSSPDRMISKAAL